MRTISETQRAYARGMLLSALEQECLLTSIEVGPHGAITCRLEEWPIYWHGAGKLKSHRLSEALADLHLAWRGYLRSGFAEENQREYSFRYHVLLDRILALRVKPTATTHYREILQRCLAFECFVFRDVGSPHTQYGAGTSSLRNPNYLLAKIKNPKSLDDVKYLPLISASVNGESSLFYHYRQHRLSPDSMVSMLMYIPTDIAARPSAFQCVSQLEGLISEGNDARVDERAQKLADGIVIPFLRARRAPASSVAAPLEFLDLGAGSGALTAAICKRANQYFRHVGKNVAFKARLMDLVLPQSRFFWASHALAASTDFVYVGSGDARDPSILPLTPPPGRSVKIGLVSQLFNNQSAFLIQPLHTKTPKGTHSNTLMDWRDTLPSRCLRTEMPKPQCLATSTSTLNTYEGKTFLQPSLARYFDGLRLLMENKSAGAYATRCQKGILTVLRKFRPESLSTIDGASILMNLLVQCSLVIVFDADLRPDDLRAHFTSSELERVLAVDMTKRLRLKRNYCYALADSAKRELLELGGERLW